MQLACRDISSFCVKSSTINDEWFPAVFEDQQQETDELRPVGTTL